MMCQIEWLSCMCLYYCFMHVKRKIMQPYVKPSAWLHDSRGVYVKCMWDVKQARCMCLQAPAVGGRARTSIERKINLKPKLPTGLYSADSGKCDFRVLRGQTGENVKHEKCPLGCFLEVTREDSQNKAPKAFIFMKNREMVPKAKSQQFIRLQLKTGINGDGITKFLKHESFRAICQLQLS